MKLTERHVNKINKLYDDLDQLTQENQQLRRDLAACSKRVEIFVEQQAAEMNIVGPVGEACLVAVRPIANHLETQAAQLCDQIDRLDMVHIDNRLSAMEQHLQRINTPWWKKLWLFFRPTRISKHDETRRDSQN